MAAAAPRLAGRGEADAERGEQVFGQREGVLGETDRLGAHRLHADLLDEGEHVLQREHADDRRGAGDHPADARRGGPPGPHGERVGVAHPARDRLAQPVEQPLGDVDEGRRAGPAVEVLVGAADRQVDTPGVELERHRADRVAQVPQHQRARVVHRGRDRRRVGQPRRAVGDVAEQHHRGLLPDHLLHLLEGDPGAGVDVDPAQREPELVGDPGCDVAVGREVVAVEHDLGATGAGRDPGAQRLVEQHRGRVAHDHLAGGRAQARRADPVADDGRQVHPGLVPAADQPAAPLLVDEAAQPLPRGAQRAAQRVAVEVDQRRLGADEAVAVRRQRVLGVQACGGLVGGGGHGACLPHRARS